VLASALGLGVNGIDCNACGYNCKLLDLACWKKHAECHALASVFASATSSVEVACNQAPGRMDMMDKIERGKKLLTDMGIIDPYKFNSVKIRWCSSLGEFADGMVPSTDNMGSQRVIKVPVVYTPPPNR